MVYKDAREAAQILIEAKISRFHSSKSIKWSEKVTDQVMSYFEEQDIEFNVSELSRLLDEHLGERSKTLKRKILIWARQVELIKEYGYIPNKNQHGHLDFRSFLKNDFKIILDDFTEQEQQREDVKPYLINYKRQDCALFFIFLQNKGIYSFESITHELLKEFWEVFMPKGNHPTSGVKSHIHELFLFLISKKMIKRCLAYYWVDAYSNAFLTLDEMQEDDKQLIKRLSQEDPEFTPDVFFDLIDGFMDECNEYRYSKNVKRYKKSAVFWLYIFLDLNELNYSPEMTNIWLKYILIKVNDPKRWRTSINQWNDYIIHGFMDPTKIYKTNPKSFDILPESLRANANKFLNLKQKEGLSKKSVSMYECCIVRFCRFMISNNLFAYSQLSPDHVIEFSITDQHTTQEARKAYLYRIKNFLLYLFEEHHINDPCVYRAIRNVAAPKCRVVKTLSNQQIDRITDYCRHATSPLELRTAAIVLIGLKTGLRGIDICNLKFSDIDWNRKTIHLIQQKTKVEIRLPFPVSAMNALFKYIRNGRPESKSNYIFLTSMAPFKPIGQAVCRASLLWILDDLPPGVGFHILRKTSASELFRRGNSRTVVSYALGHQGTKTVDKYLNLDIERIRECALELTDLGISMKLEDLLC